MAPLDHLLAKNRAWSEALKKQRPDFFRKLADQQQPGYLWIGCADSRVPANEIVGLLPGELFVHRNVANIVVPSDLNCVSVLHFAVEILRVKHIIVCGHYGCSGVRAAMEDIELGPAENWLNHVREVEEQHEDELAALGGDDARFRRLCELNVLDQIVNVGRTSPVRRAWKLGQELTVHGWVYGVEDGLIRDLGVHAASRDEVTAIRRRKEPPQ